MVLRSKQDYLATIRTRYQQAGKKAKTLILDEFCATCGYNRKYAIRMLSKSRPKESRRGSRRPGPKTVYQDAKLMEALKRIWFASDQMCSKKLKAAIPLWLPFYDAEFKPLEQATREKLLEVSSATIDRLLKPHRALHKKGRCTTRERRSKTRSRSKRST